MMIYIYTVYYFVLQVLSSYWFQGGEGSNLIPLTDEIPKCMLPLANVPLVHYQLRLLEEAGFHGMQVTV